MRSAIVAVLMCTAAGCSPEPPAASAEQLRELVALDPLLGGSKAQRGWLRNDPALEWNAEREDREETLTAWCANEDDAAFARLSSVSDRDWIAPTLAFLGGDAGAAIRHAENMAVTMFAHQPDRFPAELAEMLSDATAVGTAADRRFAEAKAAAENGASVSPLQLSHVICARLVEPEHAKVFAEFLATPTGTRWLSVRTEHWPAVQEAHYALSRKLRADGLARNPLEDELPDLLLPIEGR